MAKFKTTSINLRPSITSIIRPQARKAGITIAELGNRRIAQSEAIKDFLGPKAWAKLLVDIEEVRLREVAFADQPED